MKKKTLKLIQSRQYLEKNSRSFGLAQRKTIRLEKLMENTASLNNLSSVKKRNFFRMFAKPAKILFSLAMKLYKYKHDPAPISVYFMDKDAYGVDQTDKKDLESGAICMSGKDPVGISGVFKSSPWDAF